MGTDSIRPRRFWVRKRSLRRPDTARADRKHLVALLPQDPAELLPEGAQLVAHDVAVPPSLGHVTSSYRSAALERTFALALVESGRERIGQTVFSQVGGAGGSTRDATDGGGASAVGCCGRKQAAVRPE